jgi:hypothetical protein
MVFPGCGINYPPLKRQLTDFGLFNDPYTVSRRERCKIYFACVGIRRLRWALVERDIERSGTVFDSCRDGIDIFEALTKIFPNLVH